VAWENGTIESFNGKLSEELLNRKIFETRLEANVIESSKTRFARAFHWAIGNDRPAHGSELKKMSA
jgi:hypothetical protein